MPIMHNAPSWPTSDIEGFLPFLTSSQHENIEAVKQFIVRSTS